MVHGLQSVALVQKKWRFGAIKEEQKKNKHLERRRGSQGNNCHGKRAHGRGSSSAGSQQQCTVPKIIDGNSIGNFVSLVAEAEPQSTLDFHCSSSS